MSLRRNGRSQGAPRNRRGSRTKGIRDRSSSTSLKKNRRLGLEPLEERCLLAVQPFPVPLTAVDPQASLIYSGTTSAAIDFAGESESFTINLDSPQRLTVLADPGITLAPSVEIIDPSLTSIASTVAAANGGK